MSELTQEQMQAAVAAGVAQGLRDAQLPRQPSSTPSSSGSGGGGSSSGASFGVAAQKLEGAFGALIDPFQKAGGTVADAARNFGTLSGTVLSLGGVIPGVDSVLQGLGNTGGALIGYLENTNATFQNLSKVGGGFNGDLGALRMAAAQTRMPLEQFANMVGQNASALAGLGGGVNKGAERFAQLSRAMFEDGQTIQGMMNLGYTLEEANEFLLDNANLMRRQAMREGMSDTQVAQATLRMAENIAFMAEITGESAEQQRQELIDAQRDGKTQAALRLAEMNGATAVQESFSQAFTGLQAAGPAAQALYQDYLQTGVAMSETTQAFEAMNPAVAAQIRQISQLTESSMSADEKRRRIAQLLDSANMAAVQSTTSRTNLEVAAAGQATRIGALQADTLQSQQDFIDGVEAQRTRMEKELGRPISTQEAFDAMASETRQRIAGQSAGGQPGQELSRVLNQSTIDLANSAANVNQRIASNLSANTELVGKVRTAVEGLTTLTTSMNNFIGQQITNGVNGGQPLTDPTSAFQTLFEPIISNNAMNTNITNFSALADSIRQSLNESALVFGGQRKAGGPVDTGKYYTVGEEGPEVLVPGASGQIIPNMSDEEMMTGVPMTEDAMMAKALGPISSMMDEIGMMGVPMSESAQIQAVMGSMASQMETMLPNIRNINPREEMRASTANFDPMQMIESLQQAIGMLGADMNTSKMEDLLDSLNQSMLQLIQINNSVAKNSGRQIDAIRGAGNLLQGVSIR